MVLVAEDAHDLGRELHRVVLRPQAGLGVAERRQNQLGVLPAPHQGLDHSFDVVVVGGGSIVSYDGRFGFMGFFIVAPAERGGTYLRVVDAVADEFAAKFKEKVGAR